MSSFADHARPRLRDVPRGIVQLAVVAAAVLLLVGWSTDWFPWAQGLGGSSLEGPAPLVLLFVLSTTPLVALRSAVLGTVVGLSPLLLFGLGTVSMLPWVQYPALIAAGVVATTTQPARAAVPFLASLVPVLGYLTARWSLAVPGGGQVEVGGGDRAVELGTYLGATGLAVVAALVVKADSQRQLVREARAEEVEQESTVVAERARLARDLHDVVAHHISLIAVRAETAPYTITDLSVEARAVMAEIAGDARRSLDELRHVLGVLRRSEGSQARAPLPTLADLPDLIDQVRAAGDVVAVAGLETATTTAFSAAQSYVAYRVVQEALTNARRHAPRAPVSIAIATDADGTLDLTITNALTTAGATPQDVTEGRGLLGIRERVDALGGTTELTRTRAHHTLHITLPGRPRDQARREEPR